MKVVLCGETYSSNLGDPIIAASLREILRRVDSSLDVDLLDMSGRAPGAASPEIEAVPGRLQRWNRSLREQGRIWRRATNLAHWQMRGRRRLAAACGSAFDDADAVIIGGGQLLMDNELDFPQKVSGLMANAAEAGCPVAVHACGVGGRWSYYGHRLVAQALARPELLSLTVRDEESKSQLCERFPRSAVAPQLCLDPALWAAEAFGISRDAGSESIGISVMDPSLMRPHLQGTGRRSDTDVWARFWRDIVRRLLAEGHRVALFTNGAEPDEIFASRIVRGISEPRLVRVARPLRSEELVATIARQSVLVCARLHAGIVAYSLGVPTVAVRWDAKVPSFARTTGREAYCFDPDRGLDPAALLQRLDEARNAGVDPDRHAELRESCLTSTQAMLQRLSGFGRPSA